MTTSTLSRQKCAHGCGRLGRRDYRGLCRACHGLPEVRALYPEVVRQAPRTPCIHCQAREAKHGHRGLCAPCYKDTSIRNRYPRLPPPHQRKPALCRHCAKRSPNRSRGLCWSCYYRPGVREQYGRLCSRHSPVDQRSAPQLPEPTTAYPGTPDKVAVLVERARLGLALWHPDDPRIEPLPASNRVRRVVVVDVPQDD